MKRYFLLLLTLLPLLLHSQLSDSFGDGNFTSSPVWLGDVSEFKINTSNQLQLNQTVPPQTGISDTSFLVTANTILNDAEWDFYVKLSFAPSDNNNARIYLVSLQDNLKLPVQGYYIQLGEAGSDDSVDLFRQDGSSSVKIIDGIATHCAASTNTLRIRVTRDITGNWELFSDLTGGTNFSSEGTANDNTYNTTSYFGVFCKYTSSNVTKFYFDDFYAGSIIVDTIPPLLENFWLSSSAAIDLQFSEELTTACASDSLHFELTPDIGFPVSAIQDASDKSLVHLTFEQSFGLLTTYFLHISNISDINENIMNDTIVNFTYYFPQPNDIVINELMIDPTPPVALPEYEYIELFNNSDFNVTMSNWTLTVGSSEKVIPTTELKPDSFVLLCSTTAAEELSLYAKTVAVTSFPALTNTGQTVTIKDSTGMIISQVSYAESWYQDDDKDDGGWSLEKIDPSNHCSGQTNWKASVDIRGGTPGSINSVYENNIDILPPQISMVDIITEYSIAVLFSENIDASEAGNTTNYSLNNLGNPLTSVFDIVNKNIVTLTFTNPIPQGMQMNLTVSNISDECGNLMNNVAYTFYYYLPKPFDIIFNEIMADPDPFVNLPEFEYLELYNTSSFPVNMKDFVLEIGTTSYSFPLVNISGGGYLLVCNDDAAAIMSNFCTTAGIIGSNVLANEGKQLVLRDKSGVIISYVEYSDDWYQNPAKEDGGWSLELIDPYNPCGSKENWKASESQNGGTPGIQNSVYGLNPDNVSPVLVRATVIDSVTLKLFFSESLYSWNIADTSLFLVNHNFGKPISVSAVAPDFTTLILQFSHSFSESVTYNITISGDLTDCIGNSLIPNSNTSFSVPQPIESNDVVINEILFNPLPDGVDFVELYNRSNHTVSLDNIFITSVSTTTGSVDKDTIPEEKYLFFPGEYLVLTTDPEKVKQQYYTTNPENFIRMKSFPSFNDDAGIVQITKRSLETIDEFQYNENMHFVLLDNVEGVSLERINYNEPASDITNWHSAAQTAGFATPAYINSQYLNPENAPSEITLEPEIISPDNDGHDDFLNIYYTFSISGNVANIIIFDPKGRTIRKLVNNELLGTAGKIIWDGTDDGSKRVRQGLYLVYLEIFNPNGNIKKYKKTCIVSSKVND